MMTREQQIDDVDYKQAQALLNAKKRVDRNKALKNCRSCKNRGFKKVNGHQRDICLKGGLRIDINKITDCEKFEKATLGHKPKTMIEIEYSESE